MTIQAGGKIENTDGVVGSLADSSGAALVDGANSQWINSGGLIIGNEGMGTLNITNGGSVQSANGIVGALSTNTGARTGVVTVDGANSQWVNSGPLTIGNLGQGTLNITAAGSVTNLDAQIAASGAISSSTATVAGAGSRWTINGRLTIGSSSTGVIVPGTLRIQPGGTVSVAQHTVLFPNNELRLEGGTFSSTDISFQGGGRFIWTSGTLHAGIYRGSLVVPSGGILAPGNSAGSTEVRVNYSQMTGGILQIEIGGLAATQFDRVTVTGDAFLGGDLQLALLDSFLPSPASTLTIFDARAITGVFANVANGQRLATSNGVGSFLVNYGAGSTFNPDQIVLSNFLVAAIPGDYNQNGKVDAADYVLWRNGGPLANEVNTPGVVNAADYTAWRARFGNTAGAASSLTAAVPEPAAAILLIIGLLAFFGPRRR